MASNKTKPGKGTVGRYAIYQANNRTAINKKNRLAKHLKNHPNDEQAQQATSRGVGRTRKTPNERLGWLTESLKSAFGTTIPSRHVARDVAQVVAFVAKVSRISRTKDEQIIWRKILQAQEKVDVKRVDSEHTVSKPARSKKIK